MDRTDLEKAFQDELSGRNLEEIVFQELKKSKPYSLVELSDDCLVRIIPGESGYSKIHYGFPFPLESFDYKFVGVDQKIDIFMRGELVRSRQRKDLANKLSSFDVLDSLSFEKKSLSLIEDRPKIVYVDPFTFIGDSIINLVFFDTIHSKNPGSKSLVLSNNHMHLPKDLELRPYDEKRIKDYISDGDLVIMPDLIDTHNEKTQRSIDELKEREVGIIIPGRGILIENKFGKSKGFYNGKPDTLLRRKNVEDYIFECLEPFGIEPVVLGGVTEYTKSNCFFLNPFCSRDVRFISPDLMFNVYKSIMVEESNSEFYLVGGYHDNKTHTQWIQDFLSIMQNDGSMRRVSLNYYANLNELGEHMKEKGCGMVLTGDTSIAHYANRIGYPNLSIYNKRNWDEESLQAITGASPAGFCRYFDSHIPVFNDAFTSNEIKVLGDLIARSMLFFKRDLIYQKNEFEGGRASFVRELYDPSQIIGHILGDPKAEHLVDASEKISAAYKLENLRW